MKQYYLNKEDGIVLVVDIQEKLMAAIIHNEELVKKAGIMISGTKNLGMTTFVTEQYSKGLAKTIDQLESLLEGTPKVEKRSYTGSTDEVMTYLEETKKKQVIIIG